MTMLMIIIIMNSSTEFLALAFYSFRNIQRDLYILALHLTHDENEMKTEITILLP